MSAIICLTVPQKACTLGGETLEENMGEKTCAECGVAFAANEKRAEGVDGRARHPHCHREAHARRSVAHGGPNYVAKRAEDA